MVQAVMTNQSYSSPISIAPPLKQMVPGGPKGSPGIRVLIIKFSGHSSINLHLNHLLGAYVFLEMSRVLGA